RLGGLERLGEFGGPGRMGEVAGADHGDALAHRPPGQRPGVAVLAAGPGEARVDVQVRVKHVARYCHAAVTLGGRVRAEALPCLALSHPPGRGHRPDPWTCHGSWSRECGTTDMIMAQ